MEVREGVMIGGKGVISEQTCRKLAVKLRMSGGQPPLTWE